VGFWQGLQQEETVLEQQVEARTDSEQEEVGGASSAWTMSRFSQGLQHEVTVVVQQVSRRRASSHPGSFNCPITISPILVAQVEEQQEVWAGVQQREARTVGVQLSPRVEEGVTRLTGVMGGIAGAAGGAAGGAWAGA